MFFDWGDGFPSSGTRMHPFLPPYFLHPSRLTREEVSLEAPLGDGVVRLELDPHVVVLGGDDLGFLCSTELPMKL